MTGSHREDVPGVTAVPPGPVDERRPVVDGRDRGPEAKRADMDALRAELGDTVEELAHRVDVPARVKAQRDETAQRVRAQLGRAQVVLDEKAPPVGRAVRERPAWVGGAALAAVVLVGLGLRRRRSVAA